MWRVEALIIAIVRILGSLPVLRWALAGAIIAILVDFSDLFLRNLLTLGGVGDYQRFDKLLDLIYMATFLIVTRGWQPLVRDVALGLFGVRILGLALFEVTEWRGLLFAFPNLFEFWFLYVAAVLHARPAHRFSTREAVFVLPFLLAAKLFQEYALHVGRWLDGFTAVEAVEAIYHWATPAF